MGSQNSKMQLDTTNFKSENPFLHTGYVNGSHFSGGSSILKPNYKTNANQPNFSASTQDNASKRNSSYAEGSISSSCIFKILVVLRWASFDFFFTKLLDAINTTFRWPFLAQKVFITGSFTNWKNFIPMKKIGQEFEIILVHNLSSASVHKHLL